ncbi:unnamed protein product [Adineta ricciae]|uniref:Sodium/nucleoside cotransporter n=1 Tax=Adineta ricciae TaxID=249248 RepID=A0A815M013_ADIRI|nr:unnamed protein product [Adineta ricciae]
MTKVTSSPDVLELEEVRSRKLRSPIEDTQSAKLSQTYENSGFVNDRTDTGSGVIITTNLPESDNKNDNGHADDDDDDNDDQKDNVGFEKLTGDGDKVGLVVLKVRDRLVRLIAKRKKIVVYALKVLCLIGFIIYFAFVNTKKYGTPAFPIDGNIFSGNAGFALFILVVFAVFIVLWEKFLGNAADRAHDYLIKSIRSTISGRRFIELLYRFSWVGHILVFLAVALYIGLTVRRGSNYVSLIGVFTLIILGTLGSKYPHRVAAIVIRLEVGFQFFDFLGKEVSKFISNAEAGAVFVFGESYEDHFYVFKVGAIQLEIFLFIGFSPKVTSIIIFLGSVINMLYYLGVMQYVIGKIAWLMQKCLNTTAAESMNAAANIFVGMSEAPLMIMPLVPTMTTSELHAVLVGGFATMAGSVLATFIFFGVPANHLIAASVMAAPGALGFAKLLLPETHKSKTSWETVKNVPLPDQHNVIDALMTGAGNALKICGYLIANLIAFISVLRFLDVTIAWFFSLVHYPEVNFQYILGLLFYPFALIIGIPLKDCLLASKLIGIKVSLNEFIAYQELGKIRGLRDQWIADNTFPLYLNGTIPLPPNTQMLWNDSSVVILTYALCGFANFGSMGIALATLGVFAPQRRRALIKIAPRALIGGNMVSLMTASIAGLLYEPRAVVESVEKLNTTLFS